MPNAAAAQLVGIAFIGLRAGNGDPSVSTDVTGRRHRVTASSPAPGTKQLRAATRYRYGISDATW